VIGPVVSALLSSYEPKACEPTIDDPEGAFSALLRAWTHLSGRRVSHGSTRIGGSFAGDE